MKRETLILEAGRADRQYWRDLWKYRELLYFLAYRDVAVHYKQTFIGAAWAIIRPLATAAILTIVFRRVAKLEADGDAWYPLFVLCGMMVWQFFAVFLSDSANSLVTNANLVSKIYFPRMLVPLSTIGVPLVDLLVLVPILGIMLAVDGTLPSWKIVFAPIFLLLAALTATGFGLFLCALNVKYRDVRYALPFIVQLGVYISPIGYATSRVPEIYQLLFHLNPLVFVIDGMRWSILGVGDPFLGSGWLVSLSVIALSLVIGVRYFRQTEKTFADMI